MLRRKPEDDSENPDRWLVSYADFITLLFAFFVVMYAISSVNQGKYRQLSSSISTAFTSENTTISSGIKKDTKNQSPSFIKPPPLTQLRNLKLKRERESMTAMGLNLSNNLSPLIKDGKVRVVQNNRGIRIDINDSLLFTSGSAELAETATDILNEIAKLLQENNHAIQVEGHTDNTPIHTAVFFSNWELSAVRASSVVRMFSSIGITENRLSALGFGSAQPISENDTPTGRAKNRRVSIMILYDSLNSNNTDTTEINPTNYKK
jgi:chemotaxis protein MotB